jgi:hypothetical protein
MSGGTIRVNFGMSGDGIISDMRAIRFGRLSSSMGPGGSLAKMQANDPIMNGMIIKTKYVDAATNPLMSNARKHAGDVIRYASEFGLTPVARTRLARQVVMRRHRPANSMGCYVNANDQTYSAAGKSGWS